MEKPSVFDPIFLDSETVKIRPLSSVTWQQLAEGLLYENSFHATNWGMKTPEDIKRLYEKSVNSSKDKKGNSVVFLNRSETEVLGMTYFMNIELENKMIEIGGTWINKKHQRSSVNTETKFSLLEYAFEILRMNRVEFRVDFENTNSQKALERLGIHFDGILPRRKVNANGDTRDYHFYSVTDQSWPRVKRRIFELQSKSKIPEYPWIQKVKNLRREGNFEEAFKQVKEAITLYPESADLHYLAATICDAHRTEKEAVPFYLKSLNLGLQGNDRKGAYLGLGSTYRSLGRYEDSKKTFESGLREFPDDRPYQVFLALTEFNLGNFEESLSRMLKQLIETSADQDIRLYSRALDFYSTRLNEVFE